MKRTAIMLTGGLISGLLVAGPAQASGGDQSDVTDVCGDEFVLVGATTIGGPPGRPSMGAIVQAVDPVTRDACAFVALSTDRGTTGTLTITAQSAAATTPDGTWDQTEVSADEIDLDEDYTSDASFFSYPDDARAAISIGISGTALQGRHDVRRVVVVPATKAEKKAAKRAYKKAVKAARKALRANGGAKKFKKAVKKARDRRDDALDGHEKRVIVQVGVPTPFSRTASRTFGL